MKLNLKKCVFEVPIGKCLGFIVSERGIEADSEKIIAIQEIPPPKSVREVQHLSSCMAYLGLFLAHLREKSLLFYQLLNRERPLHRFQRVKRPLSNLKLI